MENSLNTALLVMDMQNMIVGLLPDATELIAREKKAIAYARANQIPVIYVAVGFRAGTPEISMNNKGFSASKARFTGVDPAEIIKIHAELAPEGNEPLVIKRRVSAFTGSDLEVILRSNNIQHIILTGISTSGVVLSTLREAADKDYKITVLADCCADTDEEVHRVLTTKVFPRQAEVIGLADWAK